MPGKGNPIVSCRIPRDVLEEMEREIVSQNAGRPVEPYDRAKWIVQAIRERLAKLKRGRRKGRGVRGQVEPAAEQPILKGIGPDIDATLFGWEDRGPAGEDLTAEWEAGLPPHPAGEGQAGPGDSA